jgi:hypothetical protein
METINYNDENVEIKNSDYSENYWNIGEIYYLKDSCVSNIPPYQENEKILLTLMEHQRRALSYCMYLEQNLEIVIPNKENYRTFTDKAIYCDPVGSGKSLVMLSLIGLAPTLYPKTRIPSKMIGTISIMKKNKINKISDLSVIVCPTVLFNQWKEYINTQTKLRFRYISKKSDFDDKDFRFTDGILITSSWYKTLCHFFANENISRVIFDEVHMLSLKNDPQQLYKNDLMKASFYWFISASPCDIRGHIVKKGGFFASSLFDILEMSQAGIIFRNETNLIKKKIILIEPMVNIIKCRNSKYLNILSNVVNNNILELLNADDIKGAMQSLGVEQMETEGLISTVTMDLLRKKDMILIDIHNLEVKIWKNDNAKQKAIQVHSDKIKEIENKIEMIKKRIFEENIDPITCEEIHTPTITPCCQNTFEFKSLTSYLLKEKTVCPMCRSQLAPTQLIVHDLNDKKLKSEGKELDLKYNIFKDKLDGLSFILKQLNKNSKILISSGPTANYHIVENIVKNFGYSIRKLEGSIFTKNKVLDEFKIGNLNVLYLPAYDAGSGLNIVNTTDLILLHTMTEGYTNQVIGRAQRLGRKTRLTIWKILYEDEINRL